MSDHNKIFPSRLPFGYHGQVKQSERLSSLYKRKVSDRDNPEIGNIKNSCWQRKRLDSDVMRQRKEMLVDTGKISSDTPNWWQSTSSFYRRNEAPKVNRPKPSQDQKYDVFNRQRVDPMTMSNTFGRRNQYFDRRYSVTEKVGAHGMTSSSFWGNNRQVSPKIGTVDTRNFNVRRPQLKIGQTGFVDTYSVS